MTVGELRRMLAPWEDDAALFFGDGGRNTLTLSRLKNRGPKDGPPLVQVEFNELFEVVRD